MVFLPKPSEENPHPNPPNPLPEVPGDGDRNGQVLSGSAVRLRNLFVGSGEPSRTCRPQTPLCQQQVRLGSPDLPINPQLIVYRTLLLIGRIHICILRIHLHSRRRFNSLPAAAQGLIEGDDVGRTLLSLLHHWSSDANRLRWASNTLRNRSGLSGRADWQVRPPGGWRQLPPGKSARRACSCE